VNNCRVCSKSKIIFDDNFDNITHFAFRTEYETILPKETK
jgi:DNA/RNA endonuclease YhcR with UshA esterase domain